MNTPCHVVLFSSGRGSWAAARLVADRHGTDGLVLLFSDVRGEDSDNYRFLQDAAADVGGELVTVQDGRTIWDVFRDRRFLGNTRVANCSTDLKVKPARRWLSESMDPSNTVLVVGISWDEVHRLAGIRRAYAHSPEHPCNGWCRSLWDREGRRLEGPGCPRLLPHDQQWQVDAPLCDGGHYDVPAMMAARGITPPRLYAQGFQHANCSGGCVKAGRGQFIHLLRARPDVFAEWEAQEQGLRDYLGKPVAILRDRRGKTTRPLTLRELREREDHAPATPEQLDLFMQEGPGCNSCFVQTEDDGEDAA